MPSAPDAADASQKPELHAATTSALWTALDLVRGLRDRLPAAVCNHITEAACQDDIPTALTRLAAAINNYRVTPTPDERRYLETLHHHASLRKGPK